ncbi:helix-turn-helix domain-containing protein [Mangrovicoccus ximenensis]|uniref:helix-turn-helix domain-containing protein n=1 Tax=Mangrovicoccus ximenensis TaxID=1911570 RepID=UPI001F2C1616|nr:helix-turn-helix transcriptional regulator [Mangrovicoccus ximenensis]
MSDEQFREALRAELTRRNLSALALSKGCGVSQSVLSKFLTGNRASIRLSDAMAICDYFGVEIKDFISGTAISSPQEKLAAEAKKLSDSEAELILRQVTGVVASQHREETPT